LRRNQALIPEDVKLLDQKRPAKKGIAGSTSSSSSRRLRIDPWRKIAKRVFGSVASKEGLGRRRQNQAAKLSLLWKSTGRRTEEVQNITYPSRRRLVKEITVKPTLAYPIRINKQTNQYRRRRRKIWASSTDRSGGRVDEGLSHKERADHRPSTPNVAAEKREEQ